MSRKHSNYKTKKTLSFILSNKVVFVLIFFVIGFVLYSIINERRTTASFVTQQELRRLARLAISQQELLVDYTRETLSLVAKLPQVKGNDTAECNETLASLMQNNPRFLNLGIIELNGNTFCSGLPFDSPVNLSDRVYFRRAIESAGFAVGDFQIGRITKEMSVNFGFPITDDSGQIQRIAFAALSLGWLDDFSRKADLPPGSEFIITDGSGITLVRFPDGRVGEEAVEINYPLERLEFIEQGLGILETRKPDGEKYFLVVAPLRLPEQEGFLHIVISVPKKNILN